MRQLAFLWIGTLVIAPVMRGQRAPSSPDNGSTPEAVAKPAAIYTPPTHEERFQAYLRHTFGVGSFLEAGVRAGIDQARDRPSEWPQGATGYAERYGSAMGLIVVRGTTNYALGELFQEDLRYVHHDANCSILKAALENTFTARKGEDGHTAVSVARIVGPISGTLVASTWRPGGLGGRRESVAGVGLTYGLVFIRNLARELVK